MAVLLLAGFAVAWLYSLLARPHAQAYSDRGAAPAPHLAIVTPSGERSLDDLKGKVVLVDFWATWCPPCRASIPGVEKLYNTYRSQGFEVMGVSLDDDPAAIAPFAKQMGMTYTVGRPSSPDMIGDYGAESIPTMVLVDKRGTVRWRQTGFSEDTESELASRIQQLLRE